MLTTDRSRMSLASAATPALLGSLLAMTIATIIALSAWSGRLVLPTVGPSAGHHGVTNKVQSSPATGAEAGRPATIVKPVSCESLPHVPGKSIMTAIVEFPPAAYTPAHRHPGSVTAFVLKGSVRSQLAGGPAIVYGPGQTWFEPPGALHLFAENAAPTEPAEILAVFVADTNCGPLVIPEK